jgi:hypothetical protein
MQDSTPKRGRIITMEEAVEIANEMVRKSKEDLARHRDEEARRFEKEHRCPHCHKLPWED